MAIKYLSGNRVTALSTDLVTATTTPLSYTAENGTSYVRYTASRLFGELIQTGNNLIGEKINSVTLKASRHNSGTGGTVLVGVFDNSSNDSPVHTFWTGNATDLPLPSPNTPVDEIVFGKGGTIGGTHTSTDSPTLAAGHVIGIKKLTDSSSSSDDYVYYRKTSATTDSTSKLIEYQSGSWSSSDNGTMYLICKGGGTNKLGTTTTTVPQTSWKLLARGVYDASDPDTLDSGTFTAKDNLMVIGNKLPNGSSDLHWTINGQTTGYAWRFSNNGASDVAYGSRTYMLGDSGESTNLSFQVGTMSNTLNKEKQMICNSIEASTAGNTSPTRRESVNKSIYQPQITSIVGTNVGSGSFATGSEILVLGCDNDEVDSGTNFWQELASVTLSSAGDDLDTGTFTAKKYLKIEFYSDGDGSGNAEVFPVIAFNNDTTQSNYAVRRSNNFASDDAFDTSHGGYGLYLGWGGGNDPEQCTAYISNNSGYEKLYMGEMNIRGNVNAIGDFNQHAGKWKTTSGQITRINIRNGGGSQFSTNSYLKVWGAD